MYTIKKIILFTFVALHIFVGISSVVYAEQKPGQFQGSEMEAQLNAFAGQKGAELKYSDPRIIVSRLIKTSLSVIGIIAVVLALYAGFLIMTSSGNEEKIEVGKKILMYCVVGVALILGAYSITYFIYMGIYGSINNPMSPGYDPTIQINQDTYGLYPD